MIGCNTSDDPRVIQIKGEVTLNGKPIKNGKISFTPDSQAGNKGPMGVCKIKDGKYDTTTLGGRGVVGGPHIVEIENFVDVPGNAKEFVDVGIEEGGVSENEFVRNVPDNPLAKGHFEDWDIPVDNREITRNFILEK